MKLKMAENSLFAILLRKPWWISMVIAGVCGLAFSALMPARFAVAGMAAGMPFFIIGIIAFIRHLGKPSAARIAHTRETVRTMSWPGFASAIEAAYRRDGYEVARHAGAAADFRITRGGRCALVSCKRWKAASIGVEPLRELHAAATAQDAQESIFIGIGQLSDAARRFAQEKQIRLVQEAELAQLLQGMVAQS
ncbi:restriction endonuclease [Noviherbaspirillum agri]